jgi:hypothetical protein
VTGLSVRRSRHRESVAGGGSAALLLIVAALWLPHPAGALGRREPGPTQVGDQVVITGVLELFGNEPHTYLGLVIDLDQNPGIVLDPTSGTDTSTNREIVIRVDGELTDAMSDLIRKTIRVEGELTEAAQGPGLPAVVVVTDYAVENR